MKRETHAVAAAAMAVGLVLAGCGSPHSGTASSASASSATPAPSGGTDLRSLIPTPANTQRTDGPDSIHDNGIHLHFFVNGTPDDVMDAYKTALQGKSWSVTVQASTGGGGGGGATYTGTNGNVFGVFTGGGYGSTVDIEACAWPAQPPNPNCGHR